MNKYSVYILSILYTVHLCISHDIISYKMAIKYKTNVLALLKNNGYTTYKLRKEKILGESTLQKMRTNILLSWAELNTVCTLLNVQPGDILEFIPDDEPNEPK